MRHGSRKQKRHHGEAWERIQIKHARARFGERYGDYLSEELYWTAVRACRRDVTCGDAVSARLLYEQTTRKRWYVVTILGRQAIAIFDATLDRIVTFYAPAALSDIGLNPAALGIGEMV